MPTNNRKLPGHTRQVKIREALKDSQQVSIPRLAGLLGVSEMTVRRDLEKLEDSGQVRRTRGGAVPTERMEFEFDFTLRRKANQRQKQAIAAEAATLIEAGQRIILDTGTTTLELAYLLKDFKDITVITPSLAVASVLQFSPEIQTVLLGGIIRLGSPDLTGPVTENNLDSFAVDIAFQGADGIGLDGALYNSDLRIANVDRKIRQRAEKTYILADSSKVGKTSLVTNSFIYEVEALITDGAMATEHCRAFEEMGATVTVV